MVDKDKLKQVLSKGVVSASLALSRADESTPAHIKATEQLEVYTGLIELVESGDLNVKRLAVKKEVSQEEIIKAVARKVVIETVETRAREQEKKINKLVAAGKQDEAARLMFSLLNE